MRSGTNMLVRALDRCPDTECFNENDERAFRDYRIRDLDTITALIDRSPARLVIFKPLTDSQHAVELLHRYAGAKAIWIYRHYHDAITSALKNWTEHYRYLRYVLHEPEVADWRRENLTDEQLAKLAELHDRNVGDDTARAFIWYLRTSLYFEQGLERRSDVLLVNYERLVAAIDAGFRRIAAFAGCTYSPRMGRGVFATSVGKSHSLAIDADVENLCRELWERLERTYRDLEP